MDKKSRRKELKEIDEFVFTNFDEDERNIAKAIFRNESDLSDGFGYYGNPIKVIKRIVREIKRGMNR